jgi:phosphate transport system substrate-binding protein
MSKHWRIALICMVAISLLISACGSGSAGTGSSGSTANAASSAPVGTPGAYNCVSGSITAAGSTALAPLVQAVAKDYQARCSSASITVNLGGSGSGLTQVEAGNIQIGDSDIFKKSGQDDLVDHQVAVVVFDVILNSKVTGVTNLTSAQLKGIYTGQITNWNQVGGPNLKIVVVSRPPSSGTRATFQSYVIGGPETVSGPASLTTDSTGTVVKNVQQTDGAIGYAASGPVKKASGLVVVSIDGHAATPDLVKNDTYHFWAPEHMYTKGKATGLTQALIDYMASDQGKQEMQALDFIAISDVSLAALQAHQPPSP